MMRESWEFDTDLNFEERTDVFITSRTSNRRTSRKTSNKEEDDSYYTHWLDWADSGGKKIEDFS